MTTRTEIFQLALDLAGVRVNISLAGENSRESEVCERWYPIVRKQVLRAAFWPSAKGHFRLSVLAERDDTVAWTADAPDPDWRFAYATPNDMLAPRFLTDFSRFNLGVYNPASSPNQSSIMSNTEQATLVYTRDQERIDLWDIGLRISIIHALAAYVTHPLSGKLDMRQVNVEEANRQIMLARADAKNVDDDQFESMPEWFVARGYGVASTTRYFHPYGSLIAVSSLGS